MPAFFQVISGFLFGQLAGYGILEGRIEVETTGDGPLPSTSLEILGQTQITQMFYENVSDRVIDIDTLALYEPQDVRLTTRANQAANSLRRRLPQPDPELKLQLRSQWFRSVLRQWLASDSEELKGCAWALENRLATTWGIRST